MTDLDPADLATAERLLAALVRRYPGLLVLENDGDAFLVHDPDRALEPAHQRPFCTLVTGDHHETVSRLDRDPATYRVNVDAGRSEYEARFGPAPRDRDADGVLQTGADYTATDVVIPNPFYASQYWVSVINPGPRTAADLTHLIDHAHTRARRQHDHRRARSSE